MRHECPGCGYDDDISLHHVGSERKLQAYCNTCNEYVGPPFTPVAKEVVTSRNYHRDNGWTYELYDQYGQACIFSRCFPTLEECARKAAEEKARYRDRPGFKSITVLIWPPSVVVDALVY